MQVKLLDLTRQYQIIQQEIKAALEEIMASQQFILGPKVEALEKALAQFCGTSFAVGVSSGTDALLLAMMEAGIGPGDKVITTPYTFFATIGSVLRLGASVIFADIDPLTYNLNPGKLAEISDPAVKAIMPVHLFGACADMAPILKWAKDRDVPVIEDAAQAMGAEYHLPGGKGSQRAGSMGAYGCLSFFPSKNLGGFGDSGMILTSDPVRAERLRDLRVHGSRTRYLHYAVGGNFRIDAIQAAILLVKCKYLETWMDARREKAQNYMALFSDGDWYKEAGIHLPLPPYPDADLKYPHTYNQFVIRVPGRDALRDHLARAGVETQIYYPVPLHLQEAIASLGYKEGDFPEAEQAARETLALPIYPEITEGEQEFVVHTIRDFYKKS